MDPVFFVVDICPTHCVMFSGISGFYLLDAHSSIPGVTVTNVTPPAENRCAGPMAIFKMEAVFTCSSKDTIMGTTVINGATVYLVKFVGVHRYPPRIYVVYTWATR